MARAHVPLGEFLDPQRAPALTPSGDRELRKLRMIAIRRNPYSWFWASALVMQHTGSHSW
jgi:hypothetical protein